MITTNVSIRSNIYDLTRIILGSFTILGAVVLCQKYENYYRFYLYVDDWLNQLHFKMFYIIIENITKRLDQYYILVEIYYKSIATAAIWLA